jgi:hypothetical protein
MGRVNSPVSSSPPRKHFLNSKPPKLRWTRKLATGASGVARREPLAGRPEMTPQHHVARGLGFGREVWVGAGVVMAVRD